MRASLAFKYSGAKAERVITLRIPLRFVWEEAMESEAKFTKHPSEDTLEEYAFGRLPESSTAALEEHLLVCESCQKVMSRVDEYIALMKTATAQVAPSKRSRWLQAPFSGFLPAMAVGTAALATLCLSLALLRRPTPATSDVTVTLAAFRGADLATAHAPAHHTLTLAIDARDLSISQGFLVELVNAAGDPVWTSSATATNGKLTAHVSKNLNPGLYWVRLYSGIKPAPEGLLREFGLRMD